MEQEAGRVGKADQALVASDGAASVATLSGFDPSRSEYFDEVVGLAVRRKREALVAEQRELRERLGSITAKLRQCEAVAKSFGIAIADAAWDGPHEETVGSIALDLLRTAGTGLTVTQMRPEVEARYGAPIHPKSVGVALLRLAKKGVVQRHGRVWSLIGRRPRRTPSYP